MRTFKGLPNKTEIIRILRSMGMKHDEGVVFSAGWGQKIENGTIFWHGTCVDKLMDDFVEEMRESLWACEITRKLSENKPGCLKVYNRDMPENYQIKILEGAVDNLAFKNLAMFGHFDPEIPIGSLDGAWEVVLPKIRSGGGKVMIFGTGGDFPKHGDIIPLEMDENKLKARFEKIYKPNK